MSKKRSAVPESFRQWQASKAKDIQTQLNFLPIASGSTPKEVPSASTSRQIPICGVKVDFPFQPYPAQLQMMAKIVQALQRSENALLESPTGSGKSVALLCAALAWREHQKNVRLAESKTDATETARSPLHGIASNIDSSHSAPKRSISLDDDDFQPIKSRKKEKPTRGDRCSVELETSSVEDAIPTPKQPQPVLNLPRIYIGSRTHDQIRQLVKELRENTSYRPRMTILGSRDNLCVHPKVSKSSSKADDCVALLDSNSCAYGSSTHKLLGHPKFRYGANEIWDIEDIVQAGKKVRGCPYYATRKMYENAEVIFCPYSYIIDPIVRKIMDINVKDNIIILDEAHNIEDTAREAGSFELTEVELIVIQKELQQIIQAKHEEEAHKTILYLVDTVLDWIKDPDNIFDVQDFERQIHMWSGTEIINKLNALGITANTLETDLLPAYKIITAQAEKMRNESESEPTQRDNAEQTGQVATHRANHDCVSNKGLRQLEGLFMILRFLFSKNASYADDYRMVLIKKTHKTPNFMKDTEGVFKLGFWCLNPGVIFRELSDSARSVLLTSGTLSPLDTFASELDTDFPIRLEANHVIDASQVWVGVIPRGPSGNFSLKGTFQNIEKFQYQDEIGEALHEIVHQVPFGILCFVPSYPTLDKLIKRWKSTSLYSRIEVRKRIICEPHGGSKEAFKKLMKTYFDFIKLVREKGDVDGQDGVLLFGVYRGKLSEGIDFPDDNCRAVVSLGIPFPNRKNIQVDLKYKYNSAKQYSRSAKKLLDGNRWYEIQAYRAINQAFGRCIRHQKDWGAIILLEERFTDPRKITGLSKWVRGRCTFQTQGFGAAMDSLRDFTKGRIALDASPPLESYTHDPAALELHETAQDMKLPTLSKVKDQATLPTDLSFPPSIIPSNDQPKSAKKLIDSTKLQQNELVLDTPESNTKVDQPCIGSQQLPKTDQKTHTVKCKHCQSLLMTGQCTFDSLKAKATSLRHLIELEAASSKRYPSEAELCLVLEIVSPEDWTFHHIQGDTRLSDLQDTTLVHWSPVDKLCYVTLLSNCCKTHAEQTQSKPIGALVCTSTCGSSDEHQNRVGRVYFLASAVQIEDDTRKGLLARQTSDYYDELIDVEPEELQRLYDLL